MFAEFGEAIDLEGEVSEIGLDLNGTAVREVAELDGFFAFGCLEEDEFGAARRFVAADFVQAKDLFVEFYGALEVIEAVAGVE